MSDLPPEQQAQVAELRAWGLAHLGEPVVIVFQGIETRGVVTALGVDVFGDLLALWRNIVTDERTYLKEPDAPDPRPKSVIVSEELLYWPNDIVPWDVGQWAGTTTGANIELAIASWQGVSGIQFVRRTNESDYLLFGDSGENNRCRSTAVGRAGGPQWVLLRASGPCSINPAIAHELGHAIGHFHAHQRTDAVLTPSSVLGCRNNATSFAQCGVGQCQETGGDDCGCHGLTGNDFIKCIDGHWEWKPVTGFGIQYVGAWDQNSLMHYIPTAFSRDLRNVFTLQPGANPGQSISTLDAATTRSMYVRWNDSFERNRARPGNTYQVWTDVRPVGGTSGDAPVERCNQRCAIASSCMAYEVVNVGSGSECRLKNAVGNSVPQTGAVTAIVRPGYEVGYDRWGSDLGSLTVNSAEVCRQWCVGITDCASFTFVSGQNRCYLKTGTPAPTQTCTSCTSGLVRTGGREYGVDRPGGDYNVFPMDYPEPGMCQRACAANTQCRTWAYADPSLYPADRRARCWLKSSLRPVQSVLGVVSGVL
ncbi:MAG: hypothetical protein H6726_18995 [Sandaracinaceae bacterium]|nr:hypothetical protein [Sandaracinaceae bacterium]